MYNNFFINNTHTIGKKTTVNTPQLQDPQTPSLIQAAKDKHTKEFKQATNSMEWYHIRKNNAIK